MEPGALALVLLVAMCSNTTYKVCQLSEAQAKKVKEWVPNLHVRERRSVR